MRKKLVTFHVKFVVKIKIIAFLMITMMVKIFTISLNICNI